MTQGSLPRSFRRSESVARRSTSWIAVDQISMSRGLSHKETSQEVSRQSDLRVAKSSMDDDMNHRRSATLKNQSPMGQPFSLQNLTSICADKMISMTQGSLPRSFRRSESVARGSTTWIAVDQKSISRGSTFFLCKISCAYADQNEAYDTRKPPKKSQGNPTCAWPNLRWTTT
ncbi:uncharacterized protein G2W53_026914 [Senna tora]|uniref:Uncharacterized protein n=1 Tax=Senna tora TaxID=362788 RepID=A0A834TPW4_9FABA|nr:uncharacterized protein G2W53_026914 [Senna tora]